jgi:acyl-coenzyme A thioesterase PaaI-like protein
VDFKKPCGGRRHPRAEGRLLRAEGKKRWVEVKVYRNQDLVFLGEFLCVVPDKHVLDIA